MKNWINEVEKMKNKVIKIIILMIIVQSICISIVFAALSPELKALYFISALNLRMFEIEFLLLIIAIIKKKKINSIIALLYLVWFIYIGIITFIPQVDINIERLLHIIGILLGIIIIIYTLKGILQKTSEGDK